MKIEHSKTETLLFWAVIFMTVLSLCGGVNLRHAPAHPSETDTAPIASRCMLNGCDTLTTKNMSVPHEASGILALFGLALPPLLFQLYHAWTRAFASFTPTQDPRLKNTPPLYQLHAALII